jgi:pimeloyl-ACP methyl ester carboxylesterase
MRSTIISTIILICVVFFAATLQAQIPDSIQLKDLVWDKTAPGGQVELEIPSENSLMAGVMYSANGAQKHPTLILLHGFPGNERNLDLAQVVRSKGWNVIYFNYRGSWGSQGEFSFENCVQDVVNLVAYCKKNADSLRIDTSNIALFGHSMGGFVCLKALTKLPGVKKGFALSTWNIYETAKDLKPSQVNAVAKQFPVSFVLNTTAEKLIQFMVDNLSFYNLQNDADALSNKQIIMLDEHHMNKPLAEAIKKANHNYFDYEVWQTDHPFTNKRISLINKVLEFLNRK